ncbi:MAG TPA: MgtC/SapB family protein [Pyrinomonadaceae bacterium]|nr:MgtC/SapB family protein [Pyrinomonadaceae bacterium]
MLDVLWNELTAGMADRGHLAIVLLRTITAVILGGIVGVQREKVGKPAGLRTHMLVSLGTAVVVLSCQGVGMEMDGLSRVIQGIVTGIGFVGAGTILKLTDQREIQGLTTAAGLWMTAAIGVAVGLGALGIAVIATVLTVIVLSLQGLEEALNKRGQNQGK